MQAPTGLFGEKHACNKGFPGINLLAVCTAAGIFTSVDVGQAGTVDMLQLLQRSNLLIKQALEDDLVFLMFMPKQLKANMEGLSQ